MHRSLYWIPLFIGLLVAPTRGQDITVRATVDTERAYVGDVISYSIVVSGTDNFEVTEFEPPDGVIAAEAGTVSQTYGLIGRQTTRRSLRYNIQLLRAGAIEIPPATVKVRGREYQTNPVIIEAFEPGDDPDSTLEIMLDRDTLFVGETVAARVRWTLQNAESYSFEPSEIPESFLVEPREQTGRQLRREVSTFQLRGQEFVANIERQQFQDRRAIVLEFDLMLTPTEPGTFELGPLSVVFDRITPQRTRRKSRENTEALTVEVLELPSEGRPAGFSGLVGRFDIAAAADPTSVNVGDPIQLVVRIRGDGSLRTMRNGPDLENAPGFEEFKMSADGWSMREPSNRDERQYSTTIRARSGQIEAIPPIELHFFDPIDQEYKTALTDPIPLDVRSVRNITAADAIGTPVERMVEQSPLVAGGDGIWAEDRGPSILRSEGFSVTQRLTQPIWVATIATPPAAYALIAAVAWRKRRRDPVGERRRSALAIARRASSRHGAAGAVRAYVAAVFDIEEGAVTAHDITRLGASPESSAALRDVLSRDEAARIGQQSDEPDIDARSALAHLASIHREVIR